METFELYQRPPKQSQQDARPTSGGSRRRDAIPLAPRGPRAEPPLDVPSAKIVHSPFQEITELTPTNVPFICQRHHRS